MIHRFCAHLGRLIIQDDANTATEYAVMLGLIIITALGAIVLLGERVVSVFEFEYASLEAI